MRTSNAPKNYLGDVVPSALEHARTRVALTRNELVEKVNRILKRMGEDLISGGDVESWESGGRGMTWSEAYAFTKVTMSPFNALFQTQPPPEPLTDYRSPPGGNPASWTTGRTDTSTSSTTSTKWRRSFADGWAWRKTSTSQ